MTERDYISRVTYMEPDGTAKTVTYDELLELDYAEQDEAGQLSIGIQGEQRSIPGLAKTYPQEG